jgi:hypothetical protein
MFYYIDNNILFTISEKSLAPENIKFISRSEAQKFVDENNVATREAIEKTGQPASAGSVWGISLPPEPDQSLK